MTKIDIKYNNGKEISLAGTSGIAAVMNLNTHNNEFGEVLVEIDVNSGPEVVNMVKEILKILHDNNPRFAKNAVFWYLEETGQIKDGIARISTKGDK